MVAADCCCCCRQLLTVVVVVIGSYSMILKQVFYIQLMRLVRVAFPSVAWLGCVVVVVVVVVVGC